MLGSLMIIIGSALILFGLFMFVGTGANSSHMPELVAIFVVGLFFLGFGRFMSGGTSRTETQGFAPQAAKSGVVRLIEICAAIAGILGTLLAIMRLR